MEERVNVEESLMKEKRIFVGGLGDKVTEDDLRKTFSSLGTIKAVDFVTTNGHSFAYIDFQPSSTKSLPKLFSSYNGCVWKGGRLRLEIAKEHYMVRLKREWEEDAELANKTTEETEDGLEAAEESKDIFKKSKLLTLENKQLQIFFPRLRKVKPVPYSGTGKHKYSFQRIEVPSRPIHFCDCEEHYAASEKAQLKHIPDFEDDQDGIVDDQEVNMMRSVMDKIFKKEDKSSTKEQRNDTPMENTMANNVLPSERCADLEEDNEVDNLVINIASGGNIKDQESEFGHHLISNIHSKQTTIKAQKERNDTNLKKIESNDNEFTSTMLEKKGPPETSPKKSKPDKKARKEQLLANILWRQKSSWKDLVGESGNNNSFSISHILPDAASLKQTTSNSKQQKMSKRVRFEDEVQEKVELSGDDEDSHTTESKRWKLRKQVKCKSSDSDPPEEHAEEAAVKSKSSNSNLPQELAEDEEDEAVKPKSSKSDPPEEHAAVKSKSSYSDLPEELAEGEAVKPKSFKSDTPKEHADEEAVKPLSIITNPPEEHVDDKALKENDGPLVGSVEEEIVIDKVSCGVDVPQTEDPGKVTESDKGGKCSWVQKSPWRDLVGETNSFSISHILPDPSSKRRKLINTTTTTVAAAVNPFNNMQQNLIKVIIPGSDVSSFSEKKESSESERISKKKKTDSGGTSCSPPIRKAPTDTELGQVCTFMRNAEAEKEWSKLRAAMSGSLKKKNNEKQ
ncbi:hypothetical protein ACHQM5_009112 [Ranunculus cassubicifolius]